MSLTNRLEYIRKRAKQSLPLSPAAAALLEEIRKEDPDIGEAEAFGQTLAPDSVAATVKHKTDDEENELTSFISPLMRKALDE